MLVLPLIDIPKRNDLQINDNIPKLQPRSSNDRTIMEEAFQTLPSKVKMINEARMFLKVVWLSEICTADGKCINKHAWKGFPLEGSNNFDWHRTPKNLSKRHWIIWQEFLSTLTPLGME